MDKIKVAAYLRRIGIDDDVDRLTADYALLKRLQYAQCTTVPYENLDILRKIPLRLDTDSLYDKIITHKRGGYCFELNGLLGWLLRELGYETHDYMARYLRGSDGIPMRRHRVITAKTGDGVILCDVGVGDRAAKFPLRIVEDEIQEQGSEAYRFGRDPFFGWVLYDFHKGAWDRQFAFTQEEQLDIDYAMPSYYCENHPDSIFNKEYIIAIKTASGRKTLSGNIYRVFDGDNVTEKTIDDGDELDELAAREFGLSLTER